MTHVDGNAVAGELAEVFARDLSGAVATCAACGVSGPVASVMVYEGMGMVMRCPECDGVLGRVVHARGELCLEMRGVRVLRLRYD